MRQPFNLPVHKYRAVRAEINKVLKRNSEIKLAEKSCAAIRLTR